VTIAEGLILSDGQVHDDDWREASVERIVLPEPTGHAIVTPQDPDIRVLLAVPMERTIGQLAFFGFSNILQQGWPLGRLEYTRNDIARCKFGEYLLESKFTHLLMLDSDHVHPPDVVQRLARWFRAYPGQIEVIGGLNFRRGAPFDPCAFIDPGDGTFRRMAAWHQGAVSVDALGSGSIMIQRSVFERLPKPWFAYDYTNLQDWPGTDMWFSKLCRAHGISLWCDTTTTSPHIGDRLIDGEDYRQWLMEHGVQPA